MKPDNEASTVESCKNWKLADAQVAQFFQKAEPISGERTFGWRYACEQMVLFKRYPKEGEEL